MVTSVSKTNSKNKVNDAPRRKHRRARRSPNKSMVLAPPTRAKITPSSLTSEELDIKSIRWPSRREDCAWMVDKVALSKRAGGRRGKPSPGASYEELSSTNSISSVDTLSNTRVGTYWGTQESRRKSMATNTSPSSTVSACGRQPLDSITNAQFSNIGASRSSYRPACTIPVTWRRALSNLVLQAEKERVATIAPQ